MVTEPEEDGPVAVADAVRDSDGLEVTVRLVVAKLDRMQLRRVRDEAAALDDVLAVSKNPFVLPLLDHDRDATGRPFLVTARRGPSLSHQLAVGGPLNVSAAVDAVLAAATGLELLHRAGTVHQAISPAALLRRGAGRVVLDCPPLPVLAEIAAETTEGTGHEPPEVLAGADWTPAGEVYALAATLWTLLTGRPPFPGNRAERILFAGQGSPGELPQTAAELSAALRWALVADPGARPPSVADFARRLKDRGTATGSTGSETQNTVVPGKGRALGGEYELLSPIGKGSMGTVWRARRADGTLVAVKLLHPELVTDADNLMRLVREASAVQHLDHPNLVRVRDLHIARGRGEAAVIMDLIDGVDLRQLMDSGLGRAEGLRLLSEVAAGLAAVHENGVVHRDLKPENVLVRELDGRRRALLTDFGLAKPIGNPTVTQVGHVPGTPAYLAPELIRGAAPTPASDVYALGITAYEVVARRRPFAARSTTEVLRQHEHDSPARPPDLPDAAWAFLASCLAKDPRRRPGAAQAADVLADLAREVMLTAPEHLAPGDPERTVVIAAPPASASTTANVPRPVDPHAAGIPPTTLPTETSTAPPPHRPQPPASPRSRRRRLVVAAAVVLVAAIGATLGILLGRTGSGGSTDTSTTSPSPPQLGQHLQANLSASNGIITVTWPPESATLAGATSFAVFRNDQFVQQLTLNTFAYHDADPPPPGCYQVVAIGATPRPGPVPAAACTNDTTTTPR